MLKTRKMGPWTMIFGTRAEVDAEYRRLIKGGYKVDAPRRAGGPASDNTYYVRYLTKPLSNPSVPSESKELARAIDAIKRAARLMDADPNDAQANLEEAVWTLSQLRYNAMRGLHANPRGLSALRSMGGRRFDVVDLDPAERLGRRLRLRGRPHLRGRGRRAFSSRRRNPTLAVLGAGNPPRTLKASWATIEYQRPDDPDGRNVARVHEFKDGFIAEAMEDGSVLLRHPRGEKLWTTRRA